MKIFVTGAAGYIGGSVAEGLKTAGHTIVGLVRSEKDVPLLKARGIDAVVGELDDAEKLTALAQAADAVIHSANADHAGSVITLVTALERSGKPLIHTSGSSIVTDHADGEYAAEVPLAEDDYFEPVPHRRSRVDLNRYVRQAAIEKGVRTIVICPGMIYGAGHGIQPHSDQIPKLIGLSRQNGAGVYFGKGLNVYSNVHIDDLASLYLLVLEKAPGGSFFFAENGYNSFREIAEMIGALPELDGRTVSVPVADIIRQFGESARLGVASNSYVNALNARRLGWQPKGPSLPDWFKVFAQTGAAA
ncbi:NAD-dependent epimerase/dehydratase family protein [Rhizobium lusitanum]|uniref:NAD-dependent epimerase/dehydratase family protein n=1 Tax=Rhizobium lusitanum TaxID=293958 RepID=A0A6L9UBW3_9HYPH|nr:NAD-dependent epimerase/dehydratase family protein [Rhizobium lusitanum]NEI71627.1 NAD-dependent epimerase/dehydratase family protein [Rhizobium lusitanum]